MNVVRAGAVFAMMVALMATAYADTAADCPQGWREVRPAASELTLCWQLRAQRLHIAMSHPGKVWLALGFAQTMRGADAVVGRADTGEVSDVFIGGYDAASIVVDAEQNLSEASVGLKGGRTVLRFTRALDTGDDRDHVIDAAQPTPLIWAVGKVPGFSAHFARGAMVANWGEGALVAWNLKNILHAILMFAAWGVMMPLGVLVARYYKVLAKQDYPRELDNQFWWNWHRILQYGGMLTATLGFFLVWSSHNKISDYNLHASIGAAALALAGLQVLIGILRGSKGGPVGDDGNPNPPEKIRGDHYDMTTRRRIFEFVHKKGGYLTLGFGVAAIASGLRQAELHWAVCAAFIACLCVYAGYFAYLQRSGRWVDTYAAIWGSGIKSDFLGNGAKSASTTESQR